MNYQFKLHNIDFFYNNGIFRKALRYLDIIKLSYGFFWKIINWICLNCAIICRNCIIFLISEILFL